MAFPPRSSSPAGQPPWACADSHPPAQTHSRKATGRVGKFWKEQIETAPIINSMRCKNRSVFVFFFIFLGYNAPSESQESKAPANKDPTTWSVDEVVWFIRDADPQALGPHADIFRKHVSSFPFWSNSLGTTAFAELKVCSCLFQEIDGNALLLLKSDMIMKYLGLKLGPALKLCYHIDKLKQNKFWNIMNKCIWNLKVAI